MDALFDPLILVFGTLFTLLEHVLPADLVMLVLVLIWLAAFAGLVMLAVHLFRRRHIGLAVASCVVAGWELLGPVVLLLNTVSGKA